jgi:alkylhydroperoxidase family enzyme
MFVTEPPLSEPRLALYRADIESDGYVNNLTRLWGWRPEVLDHLMGARTALLADSLLTSTDVNIIFAATAAARHDSYCSLHWGTRLAADTDARTAAGVISGSVEDLDDRSRALATWARKVALDPNSTTPADVEQLRVVGLREQEIFEATFLVAFRLAFTAVNDALGVQPDLQLAETASPAVRLAVTFGRPPATVPSQTDISAMQHPSDAKSHGHPEGSVGC